MGETITTKQLQELLQVGETTAKMIMTSIRSVSDTLGIKGVCHRQDYEMWLEARKGSTKAKERENFYEKYPELLKMPIRREKKR